MKLISNGARTWRVTMISWAATLSANLALAEEASIGTLPFTAHVKGMPAADILAKKADLSADAIRQRLLEEEAQSRPVKAPLGTIEQERLRIKQFYQGRMATAGSEEELRRLMQEHKLISESLGAERELRRLEKKKEEQK